MASEQDRITLLKEIRSLQKEIGTLEKSQTTSAQNRLDIELKIKKLKTEIVVHSRKLLKANEEIRKVTKQYLESQIELEDRVKSISDQQFFIKDIEKKRIQNMNTIDTKLTQNLDKFNQMSDLNLQIANLSDDEISKRELLNMQYEDIANSIDRRGKGIQTQTELLDEQNRLATAYASMSETQRDIMDGQRKVLDGIKKTMMGTVETAKTLYGNTRGALGGLVTLAGVLEHHITDVSKQLGFTVRDMNTASKYAGILSFAFEDTAGTVRSLTDEFGTLEAATFKVQTNIGLMSETMGISNTEAVGLLGSFSRLNQGSTDIASDMIATTKEYAKQNNVIPADVLSDLAESSELFAKYSHDGGTELIRAATQARKLGTNLATLDNISESLLDFESSMTSELELGVMLGRQVNLNKARQLAYEGKIGDAAEEGLKQLGGYSAFNQMDVFQRKAAAEALGVSVGELQKMAYHQEHITDSGEVIKETFSQWGAIIDTGLNKFLGTSLEGLGGILTATGQMSMGLKTLGIPLDGIGKGIMSAVRGSAQLLKNLLGMVAGPVLTGLKYVGSKLFSSIGESSVGKATDKLKDAVVENTSSLKDKLMDGVKEKAQGKLEDAGDSIGDKLKDKVMGGADDAGDKIAGKGSITEKIGKIKMNDVLKGAAALVIVAGAVWVFGKAVQEFMKVSWESIGMAVVSMLALVGAVALLGLIMSSGVGAVAILAGAAAMLVVAGAIWVLGKAIQEMATGFSALGMIAGVIGTLIPMIGGIGLLTLAFTGLAGALMLLGTAGIIALPGLIGLSMASKGLSVVADMFGFGDSTSSETSAVEQGSVGEYQTKMLQKMDELIGAVKSNKDVYIDKEKITKVLSKSLEKRTENLIGLSIA